VPFGYIGLFFNHLFVFFWFLISNLLFVVLLVGLLVPLCPVLFLFWVLLGSLPLALVAGSGWGLLSLDAAFFC
jgi:hypothetical protein